MTKKYFKFIYSIVICLMLVISNNVQAVENNKYIKQSGVIKNPNYASKIINKNYKETKLYNNEVEVCNSLDEIEKSIITHMRNRDNNFNIKYRGSFSNLKSNIQNIFSNIENIDDYLAFSYSQMQWGAQGYENDIKISFNFQYLTTKFQEEYIDRKVDSILKSIISSNMNDDEKEKAIHDYIVSHVAYDETYQRHSAYNALAEGTAVCQGYALLTKKMLSKVGIKSKIVSGRAGGDHAWNLVKIRGNWYHLDCTWDDPVPDRPGKIRYDYYNLSDYQMKKDHTWDENKYPKANVTYNFTTAKENSDKFDGYRNWTKQYNVSYNKSWTVVFKTYINKNSVNRNNVYVLDENLNKVDVDIEASEKSVIVKPKYAYKAGQIYYLVLEKNILSSRGKGMKSPIVMKFNVQDY